MLFKNKMKRVVSAYQEVFDTEAGKIVLQDLMKSCYVGQTTFNSDPYETHYNEGMRSVILRILKTKNTSMASLDTMLAQLEMEEHNDD